MCVFWEKCKATGCLPETREGGKMIKMNNRIGLFGGRNKNKFAGTYILRLDKWAWSRIKTFDEPPALIGYSVESYYNRVFVFGGWRGLD